jgi:tight adherence protein B
MSWTLVLIIGGVLAVVAIVIGLIVSVRSEKAAVEDRLDQYLKEQGGAAPAEKTAERPSVLTDGLTNLAGRFSWGETLSKELARADLKLRVGEYIAVMIIAAFGLGAVAYLLGGRNMGPGGLVIGLIGAAVGFFIPRIYVGNQKTKRLTRFDEQLADMLNLMVNGLRAGYSTMQAMEAVSKELPPPISDEFRRVVQEMQLGVPMEKTLENLMRRIPSKDLDLVVTAINVQREVGGNLAEILSTISHTIRERVRVKGEIRVMVSQVMMSGQFLSALPVFLAAVMYFLNRQYMMLFFDPNVLKILPIPIGVPILATAGVLIVIGYFMMKKMADIEV